MGIRLTSSEKKTALFNSVTGIAFGEVFESEEEADAFLSWVRDEDGRDIREPAVYADVRKAWNEQKREAWEAAFEAEWSWEASQAKTDLCPFCKVELNSDDAHSNGVCPSYEAFASDTMFDKAR